MTVEHLIKRTIWVAKCECGYESTLDREPPKARLCQQCKKWLSFGEVSAISAEYKAAKSK